ncbi:hit finger domain protein [Teratosphaeria destructans]|uniref:Hit finger domain protein n=1 Tax=Teratosphaeria destructans TaxID=418781 RepID=A0A9W7W603_9PEZI|nr:hit finger domain protein [Teratosphaeria destructans]
MATGALRFRTPHIEEIPSAQSKQAPGFAWIAVAGSQEDPAKNWGTSNRKRARQSVGGQTEQQREALTARQQRDIERKIRELNNDGSNRDVAIPPTTKKEGASGGVTKAGRTPTTKKILSSGKTFAHYLDDEEAEISRTGRRDGETEAASTQRASKTPFARRRSTREDCSMSGSPAPSSTPMGPPPLPRGSIHTIDVDMTGMSGEDTDDEENAIAPLPSVAEIEALLNAPPLTYNQARSAPPPPTAPPPRKFCETCGYWGRIKCMRCGAEVCSVACKDEHDQIKCMKMYA